MLTPVCLWLIVTVLTFPPSAWALYKSLEARLVLRLGVALVRVLSSMLDEGMLPRLLGIFGVIEKEIVSRSFK